MNLLSSVKRPRIRTEKFEILYNLCADFNRLSAANREKKLEEYLSSFSNRDCIPDLPDSELSVLIESHSE